MTAHASGTFEVKLKPEGQHDKAEGSTLGQMTMEKQFHGDLEAVARGQMPMAGTDVKNSDGYIAIERITGRLHGRGGSFALQHSGVMTRGTPQQSIAVVPDYATGQLAGLAGNMTVVIEGGKHSYHFEYMLPEVPSA